jgi:predicted anti-sigma-YlaC factor YlaD
MTCTEAHRALLEAEPSALLGKDASPLAEHLAQCPDCRALAGRVLAVNDRLRAERGRAPRTPVHVALRDGAAAARRVRRARRVWLASLPALAAAGILVMLVVRGILPTPTEAPVAQAAAPPGVDASARHVAVFTTDNPNIIVVWQF